MKYTELREIKKELSKKGINTEIIKVATCEGWIYKLFAQNEIGMYILLNIAKR